VTAAFARWEIFRGGTLKIHFSRQSIFSPFFRAAINARVGCK